VQQQVFKDFDQLVAAVRECCAERRPFVIVVEGFPQSGKSALAIPLSVALGTVHVEIARNSVES